MSLRTIAIVALTISTTLATSQLAYGQRVKMSETVRLFQDGQRQVADGERFAQSGARVEASKLMKRALVNFKAALKRDPSFVAAAVALADLLLKLDRSKEAIAPLKKALNKNRGNSALMHLLGIHLFRLGRHQDGEKYLEQVSNQTEGRFDVHYLLAGHYYRSRRYNKALRHVRAFLKLRKNDVQIRGMLGNIHLSQGRLDDAVAAFRKVLKLDPTNITVRMNLGNVFFRLKDYNGAIDVYSRVIEFSPDLALAHHNLGSCYFAIKRWRKAAASFESFLQLEPKNAGGHLNAGKAFAKLSKFKTALKYLQTATQLNPKSPWAPYEMARIQKERNQLTSALSHIAVALSRRPKDTRILLLAGVIARQVKDYVGAVRHLTLAASLARNDATIRAELGYSRILAGKRDDGINDLKAARTLKPTNSRVKAWLPVALTRRAIDRYRLGQIDAAQSDLEEALVVNKKQVPAAWNLTLLKAVRGDTDGAMATVNAALSARPKNPDLNLAIAYIHLKRGEAEAAQKRLQLSSGATDVGVRWLVQGTIHSHFGEYEAAIAAFVEASERNIEPGPILPLTQLDRAASLLMRGRSAAAIAQLNKMRVGLDAAQMRIRNGLLVLAYLKKQQNDAAIPALMDTFMTKQPPPGWGLKKLYDDAHLILGYVRYRLGNEKKALEHLEKHSKRYPNDKVSNLLIAHVLEELAERDYVAHRYTGAAHQARRALSLVKDSPRLTHNLACIRYSRGEHVDAARTFALLHEEKKITEAGLNLGLYLDDVRGRSNQALTLFREYVESRGIAAEIAEQRIRRKERIFGQ